MKILPPGTRFQHYYKYNHKKYEPYDYARYGILNRMMSHKIVNGTNPFLKQILHIMEQSLVFIGKYIDTLKNFKNPNYSNT